jgi:hypothetical protein
MSAEHIFDYLVRQGKQMTFLPLMEDPEPADEDSDERLPFASMDDGRTTAPDDDTSLARQAKKNGREERREHELQTGLEADLLETRLRRMRSDAVSFIQETGNNHLFLALGFLRWKERADATESHDAPLILIPVEVDKGTLSRKAQRYVYKIRHTGEDLVPNWSLREKLRHDHNLILPMFNEGNAVAVAGEEEIDPEAYFDTIAKAVADTPGWEVCRKAVVAFFTFAKLQMYLDLDPKAWPGACIADNGLIQRLLGCREHPPESGTDKGADEAPEDDAGRFAFAALTKLTSELKREVAGA